MTDRSPKGEPAKIYGPAESMTGRYGPNLLAEILDGAVPELAASLTDAAAPVRHDVILEVLSHGQGQKAALLAREFVKADPSFRTYLQDHLPTPTVYLLLTENVLKIKTIPNR